MLVQRKYKDVHKRSTKHKNVSKRLTVNQTTSRHPSFYNDKFHVHSLCASPNDRRLNVSLIMTVDYNLVFK